jgi:cytidylate kinase
VSADLGFTYVDTGAMYRSIALYFLKNGISESDSLKAAEALKKIAVDISYKNGEQQVMLNGENVNGMIRTEEVSSMASKISALPAVREKLLSLQRALAGSKNVIMDGRDIGTVVLPLATLKIFLVASVHVRALRRFEELKSKGEKCDLSSIEKEMELRDKRDMTRESAPLKKADDAAEVDTSDLSIAEVKDRIISLYREALSKKEKA